MKTKYPLLFLFISLFLMNFVTFAVNDDTDGDDQEAENHPARINLDKQPVGDDEAGKAEPAIGSPEYEAEQGNALIQQFQARLAELDDKIKEVNLGLRELDLAKGQANVNERLSAVTQNERHVQLQQQVLNFQGQVDVLRRQLLEFEQRQANYEQTLNQLQAVNNQAFLNGFDQRLGVFDQALENARDVNTAFQTDIKQQIAQLNAQIQQALQTITNTATSAHVAVTVFNTAREQLGQRIDELNAAVNGAGDDDIGLVQRIDELNAAVNGAGDDDIGLVQRIDELNAAVDGGAEDEDGQSGLVQQMATQTAVLQQLQQQVVALSARPSRASVWCSRLNAFIPWATAVALIAYGYTTGIIDPSQASNLL